MTDITMKAKTRGDDSLAADFPVSTAKVADYTVLAGDIGKEILFNGSDLTCTLPSVSVAGVDSGWNVIIRNAHTTPLTIDPDHASQTIDGKASVTLQSGQSVWLRTDDSVWNCLAACDGIGGGDAGSRMYRVKVDKGTTSLDDIDLDTCASGGTAVGDAISGVDIPTSGIIRVTMQEGVLGKPGANNSIGIGLKIGTTYEFFKKFQGGTGIDVYAPKLDCEVDAIRVSGAHGVTSSVIMVDFDIEKTRDVTDASFIPTGTQSIQILMGDNATVNTPPMLNGDGELRLNANDGGDDAVFAIEIIPAS